MTRYRTTLRPVPFGGLPSGIGWRYLEWPTDCWTIPRGATVSRWRYGVFETDRPLTEVEMTHFDIVRME